MRIEQPAATIAVVDDDPDSLLLAEAILSAAGHRVITDSGTPGLGVRLRGSAPDLILLDLHLEDRDGDAALREIRAEELLRAVRVVGLTGALPGDPVLPRVQSELAGLITKPLHAEALTQVIQRCLSAASSGIDAHVAGLRQHFLEGLTVRLKRMEQALSHDDLETLVLEVHKLRGAAGGFAYNDIAAAAAVAETALRGARPDALASVALLIEAVRALVGDRG
jgi:two-component system response regulator GlrR